MRPPIMRMKCIPLFFFVAAALGAADFTTGQAARLVIGQETFTSQDTNSSASILGGVSGLAYGADTLFVADANYSGATPSNHRVLLFQNLSTQLPGLTSKLSYNRICPVCVGQATVVLGQPDFNATTLNETTSASTLRTPTAVATDGVHLAVADTDNNRVLIWNHVPAANHTPADVVLGQTNMAASSSLSNNQNPTASTLRGPQGVWIQNGKLFVADTQNNRVLIWNTIPATNGKAADVVLGQPNFTTFVQSNLTQTSASATAKSLLNPVSVTSDGLRLFVADLGDNRVLIWNSIPTANDVAADVEIGQPDMVSAIANNAYSGSPANSSTDSTDIETPVMCTVAEGVDAYGNPLYPSSCNFTLNYPRFALSTGSRLFVSDSGNDRVLVYNQIPTSNGAGADLIIGQIGGQVNQASDAADSLRTPQALAWDGLNLYVADAYNRRVTVYTMAENAIPYGGVVNGASLAVYATGHVTISGLLQTGDEVELGIQYNNSEFSSTDGYPYTYTITSTDTLQDVVTGLVKVINSSNDGAGDPYVIAVADLATDAVVLNSRIPGYNGNLIYIAQQVAASSSSSSAEITASLSGSTLSGGQDAASIAPGSVVTVRAGDGFTLASQTAVADLNATSLPTELGGAQVYFNGIPAPLSYVSPTQINAQIPWEVGTTTSINAYVRAVDGGGNITVTTPVAVTVVTANPGIFANQDGTAIPPALATHSSSYAQAIVSVDGSAIGGDTVSLTVGDNTYTYTILSTDTLQSIRDALISQMSADPLVIATASGVFTRILLQARVQGPQGNGIPVSVTTSDSANAVLTALSSTTCCSNVAGAPVNQDNPAQAGETVALYATGLGVPELNDIVKQFIATGQQYPVGAPVTAPPNTSDQSVSAMVGGVTGDIISASLMPGTVGVYQVLLHLNSGQIENPYTQFWIAQGVYTSNIVTMPVVPGR
jgi:uncharacterized protein (TIGR03437 family)